MKYKKIWYQENSGNIVFILNVLSRKLFQINCQNCHYISQQDARSVVHIRTFDNLLVPCACFYICFQTCFLTVASERGVLCLLNNLYFSSKQWKTSSSLWKCHCLFLARLKVTMVLKTLQNNTVENIFLQLLCQNLTIQSTSDNLNPH